MKAQKIASFMAATALFGAVNASAAMTSVSFSNSYTQTTTWGAGTSQIISVPQIDLANYPGCDLIGISYRVTLDIKGTLGAENLSATSPLAGATLSLSSQATYLSPEGNAGFLTPAVAVFNPAVLGTFDGTIDFGGTSGASSAVSPSDNSGLLPVNPIFWGLYTVGGTTDFFAGASGASSATGSGNFASKFTSVGTVTVDVVYDLECNPVPEAGSTAAAAGLASLILGAAYRRFVTRTA